MTLPTPSPHVPIENALEDLSVQATEVSKSCMAFDTWEEQLLLCNDAAINAVIQAFDAIHGEVKFEATINNSVDSPMREIQSVSRVLGQIAHHVGVLNRQLQGKN